MTGNQIIAIAAIVLAAWLGRYEAVNSSVQGAVRLDRWTGLMETCGVKVGEAGTRIIGECK